MHILICSILRDNEPNMSRFINQIYQFVNDLKNEHTFSISLYENDSRDGTPNMLQNLDLSRFQESSVICDILATPKFGSVVAEERVKNLGIARTKALKAKDMYLKADYILFIDCDVQYNRDFIPNLINFNRYINFDIDVLSGMSVTPLGPGESAEIYVEIPARSNGLPRETGLYRVYDTWGTRRTANEEWGSWYHTINETTVDKFWVTYNSVCLYNAKPFKEGVIFHHYNNRLNKFDLEVAVVCEEFRERGYDKIFINQKLFCFTE